MEDGKPKASRISYPSEEFSIDRRDFIKIFGGGIIVFFAPNKEAIALQGPPGMRAPSDLNAYLRIAEDGKVTIYTGKIEMGQGVITSLAQMAADELGVSLESIKMILGDTDLCPYDMGTFGSMSIRFFGPALRAAAAEARAILLKLAAGQLKTPKEKLSVENGIIFVTSNKKAQVTFGQLTKGQKITHKLDGKAIVKSVSEYTVMGKSPQSVDAIDKVTGKAQFTGDLRLPGMAYAKILRPPAHGATLKKVDTSAAEKTPGATLIKEDGLIAVLHEDPEIAEKALGSIKAEFDVPEPAVDDETIFDYLVKSAPQSQDREKKGDLAQGEQNSTAIFEGKYLNGYGAHATIETHTALARIEGGKATVWSSTQTPFPNQQQIAQALGFTPENVRVITPFVGAGFGGKSSELQAVEAAKLAKISGKPVQVTYSRADDFFYDFFRPAAVVKIKSGIDADAKICLWDCNIYFSGSRSSEQFYDVPNNIIRIYGNWMGGSTKIHPFGVGAWRAPGANINVFSRESQIDIMATKARIDPLEFRLKNTSDKRMQVVLQTAADRFGWKKAILPSGRGYGIACGIDAGAYVAAIAEVQVDKESGNVKVKRIVCAQDMGIVINPEGAKMQMEGCLTMGLGYTLTEDVRFKGGEIFTRSFGEYKLPRFSQLPEIETILVKNDELEPQGGGEPAIVLVGAIVANAIFDTTGARLFQMPFTPERVKEAIRSSNKI